MAGTPASRQCREVNLTECAGLSSATLLAALTGLPHLEALVLDGVVEAGDELLTQLPQSTPLQRLSLCRCPVTDRGVCALAERLPSLQEVGLDDCTKVSPAALSALARRCRRLHVLSLRRCTHVTDEAVAEVAELGTLRDVALSGIRQVGPCMGCPPGGRASACLAAGSINSERGSRPGSSELTIFRRIPIPGGGMQSIRKCCPPLDLLCS